MASKQSIRNRSSKTKAVRFDLHAPEAQNVSVVGDFNKWDVSSLQMKKDKGGTWKARVNLKPGRYEYRLLVDGVWQDDPKAHEKIDNPFGCQNCVMFVS
jgi:1,4-alpha-glucan branching enzyme